MADAAREFSAEHVRLIREAARERNAKLLAGAREILAPYPEALAEAERLIEQIAGDEQLALASVLEKLELIDERDAGRSPGEDG